MLFFPWLILILLTALLAALLVSLAARLYVRRRPGTIAPFTVGVMTSLIVSVPLLLAILVWGLLLKPR